MKEVVLHYIWEKQLFKKHNLLTTAGASLQVVSVGTLNREQGPDFSQAVIVLDGVVFSGSIEIHLRSSDWIRHQHRYNNVILHVVLHHDKDLKDESGYLLPVLALENRLIGSHIPDFQRINEDWDALNCRGFYQKAYEAVSAEVLRNAGENRLKELVSQLSQQLRLLEGDWERLAKWLLFKTAGQPQNTEPMEAVFYRIPWKLLARKSLNEQDWLVIIRGISGLFKTLTVSQKELQNQEFAYWKSLLNVQPIRIDLWKTGKMRPAHHPEKRLQLLAAILSKNTSLSQLLIQLAEEIQDRKDSNQLVAFEWKHTAWGRALLINAAIPYYTLYQERTRHPHPAEPESGNLWERLPAEDNRYTRIFRNAGFVVDNALKSQGVLQHYRNQCNPGKCMQCEIAVRILQTDPG